MRDNDNRKSFFHEGYVLRDRRENRTLDGLLIELSESPCSPVEPGITFVPSKKFEGETDQLSEGHTVVAIHDGSAIVWCAGVQVIKEEDQNPLPLSNSGMVVFGLAKHMGYEPSTFI